MIRSIVLLCATALMLGPVPAMAGQWEDLRKRLDSAIYDFESVDYAVAGFAFEGSLREGSERNLDLRLTRGTEIMIVGLCDSDCTDVDLRLYDPSGSAVESDLLRDDFPMLKIIPSRSGVYRVKVQMAACSREPCYYTVQAFTR